MKKPQGNPKILTSTQHPKENKPDSRRTGQTYGVKIITNTLGKSTADFTLTLVLGASYSSPTSADVIPIIEMWEKRESSFGWTRLVNAHNPAHTWVSGGIQLSGQPELCMEF